MNNLKNNWPGLIWAFFILLISTFTPPAIDIPNLFDLFAPDKIVHFIIYGILVVLLNLGFRKANGFFFENRYTSAFLLSAVYGGLIEVYQGVLLPNRTGDYVDFIANCIGCFIGLLVVRFIILEKKIRQ